FMYYPPAYSTSARVVHAVHERGSRTRANPQLPRSQTLLIKTFGFGIQHLLKFDSFLPPSRCGEMLNGALYPIVLAIGFHRIDRVVVGCPRLQTVHAHAENGIGMARVQPDWRFCCLTKFLGICTVTHDSVMLGRATRVVTCPPDNRKIGVGPFDLWPLRDPDARSFFSGRALLRGSWG